ncbi:major facilitator superfamily transporter [Colletotrichum karsti]|uniref:Major facilitator superfamily transporter n=1 Tax=Colletotrichum karsti TaxID=1095194 RepID=A0A9P6HT89_9PEZI|nr:major facilitator superfamily transporter [Colletotrichum karsti]KAF9869749.1 major facilitator superfamily transporter [Colletotrichum karsti]
MASKAEDHQLAAMTEELETTKKTEGQHVVFEDINPEEERALVRKLDRVLMPLMAFVYFFQYLDKQSINYASVFGLRKDLRLTGQDFSWVISLFYFGQLCSEYPAAYLMGRLPITLFVGVTIILWGAVEMCLGATHDFRGLAAARFFLGFAEGAVSPAFIIITSNWYRRREHPIRVATWVSMSGVSQILGSDDFSSLVINGFGYSPFQTMLVGLPGGAISFVTIWISALVPRFFPGTRVYTSIGLSLIPLLGSAMLLALPAKGNDWGIVASTWLAACCSSLLSSSASMMASNVKGNTKKSVVSAGFFIVYCVGCIVSPQAWTESDAPRYTKGCILSIASWIGLILTYVVYGVAIRRENAKRDGLAGEGNYEYMVGGHDGGQQALQMGVAVDSDLTDVQDKGFRYNM